MATSLIPNKFLCYQTEAAFKSDLKKNYVSTKSIVLVLDKQYIYSHGKYFYCEFSPEVQKTIAGALSEIKAKLTEDEKVTAAALATLNSEKIGRDEFDVDSIKQDIRNQGAQTASATNSAIRSALAELESALNDADLEGSTHVTAAALTELKEQQDIGFEGLAKAVNDLRSQVRELQEKVNKLTTT